MWRGCLTTLFLGPVPCLSPEATSSRTRHPGLAHSWLPARLSPHPRSLLLKRPGRLTGILPKDCVAHELEEALGVEAGPVDGDSVLGRDVGLEGKPGCEHYGALRPTGQPSTDHCGGWGATSMEG